MKLKKQIFRPIVKKNIIKEKNIFEITNSTIDETNDSKFWKSFENSQEKTEKKKDEDNQEKNLTFHEKQIKKIHENIRKSTLEIDKLHFQRWLKNRVNQTSNELLIQSMIRDIYTVLENNGYGINNDKQFKDLVASFIYRNSYA